MSTTGTGGPELAGTPVGVQDAAPAATAGRAGEAGRGDLTTLARGGAFSFVGLLCKAGLGSALYVVVARGLGAGGAGVFFSSVALFTILTSVAQWGAHTGSVRIISRYRALDRVADLRTTLWLALGPVFAAGVLLAAGVILLAPQLAGVFVRRGSPEEAVGYLRILAAFIPLYAVSTVALSAGRGFGSLIPYVSVENIGMPAIRIVGVLAAVAAGLGASGVIVTWALPVALGCAVALFWLRRLLRRAEAAAAPAAPPRQPVSALAREFWSFSAPRGLAGVFQVSISWLDVILVGSLRSAREAGVYAAVSRAVVLGTFGLEAVRLTIAPQISGLLARGERERAQRLYQTASWWLIAASWPAYCVIIVFAPVVLRVFGAEFADGQTPLVILSVAMLANLATGNVTTVLLMGGKSSWNLFNTAAALTSNVVLNLVLIPRYGIAGAAIAWTASIVVDNSLALAQTWRLMGMRPFGRGYPIVTGSALLCFGAGGMIARALLGPSVPGLLAAVVVGGCVYVAVLWRFRGVLQLGILRGAAQRRRARPTDETDAGVTR
ncbi:Wzx-type polysaccharide biosynthesis protein UppV [soil metagenome]|jgi:O-antigen/teichoic acid export membrane protein